MICIGIEDVIQYFYFFVDKYIYKLIGLAGFVDNFGDFFFGGDGDFFFGDGERDLEQR